MKVHGTLDSTVTSSSETDYTTWPYGIQSLPLCSLLNFWKSHPGSWKSGGSTPWVGALPVRFWRSGNLPLSIKPEGMLETRTRKAQHFLEPRSTHRRAKASNDTSTAKLEAYFDKCKRLSYTFTIQILHHIGNNAVKYHQRWWRNEKQ